MRTFDKRWTAIIPPGQQAVTQYDGEGVRIEWPANATGGWIEVQYEGGLYRSRVDGGTWSEWREATGEVGGG